jgi:formate dehydrogenase major subunit
MGCEPASLTGSISLSAGREVFERAWRVPVSQQAGLRLSEMMEAALAGRLKGLWAIGYDLLLTNPNATETERALAALDLLVVQDLFLNETARELARRPARLFVLREGRDIHERRAPDSTRAEGARAGRSLET